jgi:hypothetical protein
MLLDPRPLVEKLNRGDREEAWGGLWNELHHQGDVGEASYAAVPLLVQSHRKRGGPDWNVYALVSTIELARTEPQNPAIPEWLADDYFRAIQELASLGIQEIASAEDRESVRAILSIIALAKGIRLHAKFLLSYEEDELREIELKAFE